ncbi:MAG: TetR/AcrR family transcriptional regulator [Aquabacterium sp.]
MTMPSATSSQRPASSSRRRSYKGLSPDQRSQQRREKLLEAAIHAFGTLGLRQTTMRDICHEARIAERYFSEHFANASQAYEAAFKRISEQALATVGMAMMRVPLTTRDIATAGLTAFFEFVKEDPRRAQILLIDASSYWSHVTIRTNPELNKHALLMRHFTELIYPDLPVARIQLEIIGSALIGASLQSCLTWAQGGFRQPTETVVRHLMFMWEGLDAWFLAEIQAERAAGST